MNNKSSHLLVYASVFVIFCMIADVRGQDSVPDSVESQEPCYVNEDGIEVHYLMPSKGMHVYRDQESAEMVYGLRGSSDSVLFDTPAVTPDLDNMDLDLSVRFPRGHYGFIREGASCDSVCTDLRQYREGLGYIRIYDCNATDSVDKLHRIMRNVRQCEKLMYLECNRFKYNREMTEPYGFSIPPGIPLLERLELDHEMIASIRQIETLEYLDLSGNIVSSGVLADFSEMPNLKCLISHNMRQDELVIESGFEKLEVLDLYKAGGTCPETIRIENLPELRVLILTAGNARAITIRNLPKLQALVLHSSGPIEEHRSVHFGDVPPLKFFEDNCNIRDDEKPVLEISGSPVSTNPQDEIPSE
jgi:hypothetical protein